VGDASPLLLFSLLAGGAGKESVSRPAPKRAVRCLPPPKKRAFVHTPSAEKERLILLLDFSKQMILGFVRLDCDWLENICESSVRFFLVRAPLPSASEPSRAAHAHAHARVEALRGVSTSPLNSITERRCPVASSVHSTAHRLACKALLGQYAQGARPKLSALHKSCSPNERTQAPAGELGHRRANGGCTNVRSPALQCAEASLMSSGRGSCVLATKERNFLVFLYSRTKKSGLSRRRLGAAPERYQAHTISVLISTPIPYTPRCRNEGADSPRA